ncbi:hypothetical protein M409DRAFT_49646 [Zasmidium cellare ATCC 36951]|uniref:Uncharacterized protein n=1 Tax=Zasmidium cellare ATCC 36951 TaxID=1080233 RepID=A0A6A6D152_ZASCE|nr:uncharacterized protein M409DRAFT_49646 [Zasmidium cellare ATCC 36951]KAF2173164.1 hypothetical protein M409DRAFT_49646 [Zasmidium cellare ATCC 36951]
MGKCLSNVFRFRSRRSKKQQCQDQEIELAIAPRSPTPTASLVSEPTYTQTQAAEQSLEDCLPPQNERSVWQDEHDRSCFILEALIFISGNGTFNLEDKSIALRYSKSNDKWRARLVTIFNGEVFGPQLESDIPRPSQREAFLDLKDEVRNRFKRLINTYLPEADPSDLVQRLELLRGERRREDNIFQKVKPSRTSTLPSPSPPAAVLTSKWDRLVKTFRGNTKPLGAGRVKCLEAATPSVSDASLPSPTTAGNVIGEYQSKPSLKALSKRPVRDHGPSSKTATNQDLSAEQQQQMIRARSTQYCQDLLKEKARIWQNMLSECKEGTCTHQEPPEEILYETIQRRQQCIALSMNNYDAGWLLSLPISHIYYWRRFPDIKPPREPYQLAPTPLIPKKDSIPRRPNTRLPSPRRRRRPCRVHTEMSGLMSVPDQGLSPQSQTFYQTTPQPVNMGGQIFPSPVQGNMGGRTPFHDSTYDPQAGRNRAFQKATPQPVMTQERTFAPEPPPVQTHMSSRTSFPDLGGDLYEDISPMTKPERPRSVAVKQKTCSPQRVIKRVSFPDLEDDPQVGSSKTFQREKPQSAVDGQEFSPELPKVQKYVGKTVSFPDLDSESQRTSESEEPQSTAKKGQESSPKPPRIDKPVVKRVSIQDSDCESQSGSRTSQSGSSQSAREHLSEERSPPSKKLLEPTEGELTLFPDLEDDEPEVESGTASKRQTIDNKTPSKPDLPEIPQVESKSKSDVGPNVERSEALRLSRRRYKCRSKPNLSRNQQAESSSKEAIDPQVESSKAAAQRAADVSTPPSPVLSQLLQARSSRGAVGQGPTPHCGTNTNKPSCLKLSKAPMVEENVQRPQTTRQASIASRSHPLPQDHMAADVPWIKQPQMVHQPSMTSLPQDSVMGGFEMAQQLHREFLHQQQMHHFQQQQYFFKQSQHLASTQPQMEYPQQPQTQYMQQPQSQYMQQPQSQYVAQPRPYIQPQQQQYIEPQQQHQDQPQLQGYTRQPGQGYYEPVHYYIKEARKPGMLIQPPNMAHTPSHQVPPKRRPLPGDRDWVRSLRPAKSFNEEALRYREAQNWASHYDKLNQMFDSKYYTAGDLGKIRTAFRPSWY